MDLLLRLELEDVDIVYTKKVAIPVVVDLLLRLRKRITTPLRIRGVAIPVVVDLLLRRVNSVEVKYSRIGGRNPCCSGPTA